jgi:hypothetical protein
MKTKIVVKFKEDVCYSVGMINEAFSDIGKDLGGFATYDIETGLEENYQEDDCLSLTVECLITNPRHFFRVECYLIGRLEATYGYNNAAEMCGAYIYSFNGAVLDEIYKDNINEETAILTISVNVCLNKI